MTRDEALAPTIRWSPERKLRLLLAIRDGVITVDEAITAHGFSRLELKAIADLAAFDGAKALRTTRTQQYRRRQA